MYTLSQLRTLRVSTSALKPTVRLAPGLKHVGAQAPIRMIRMRSEPESTGSAPPTSSGPPSPAAPKDLDLMSESERKQMATDKLRAAEKFMVTGGAKASCRGCGFEYTPDKGDPDFPVPKGVKFIDLPSDYCCPICGAGKSTFNAQMQVVAGFAENQTYGFGANTMTGDQKQLLIYGSLALFFVLFIAGYGLE
eukprot:gene7496-645_t